MAISNFDKRLLIEQIRYIEAKQKLACDGVQEYSDPSIHMEFEERLWKRAQCMAQQHQLSSVLVRAARISRYVKLFALLLVALLGALGVSYAVSDSNTINIYWLLLVLLGFNFLSMLLWLAGIGLNMQSLSSGVLARLSRWLAGRLSSWLSRHGSKNYSVTQTGSHVSNQADIQVDIQADRAWLACHFSGVVGKWQLSKITHLLWLTYLLAGLMFLVLLLMVRQYDFVWGTTLLSDDVFIKLTGLLSTPLEALGFATPSAEQVQDTRIVSTHGSLLQTAAAVLTAEHRSHWAQFLLGALLCFGIVPRIVLWGLSALMFIRSRGVFALDLYLPYYIRLRQQLMPLASHGEVVDADTSPPVVSGKPNAQTQLAQAPHPLPAEALWVAVELDNDISWPPQAIKLNNNLGQVVDRESLSRIQQQLLTFERPLLAVAVSAARAPDRGVQRTISSLMAGSRQRWLVLLRQRGDDQLSSKRQAAWYRLAESCDVPADHVISMSLAQEIS